MKANNENPGKILDQAIEEIRNAPVSAEAVEKAAAKVRHRLQEEYYKVFRIPPRRRWIAFRAARISVR